MAFLSSMDIVGSGLTAQQLRLDVISENVTNVNTTRTEEGGPYRRKLTVLEAVDGPNSFRAAMAQAARQAYSADITAFNVLKSGVAKGLEIGR